MPKLTIDGHEVEVPTGTTILQACEHAGIEIAHFCYHERLAIAGNCRMCLVEVEKSPKPIASCAMPAADGMVVLTQSPKALKARKGVMEFLLINHPLDCPICDQGGECDLQDQAMAYGFDRGRFEANKRAVPDKNFGPLVETHMNRCIHCTRCVRFTDEVAGTGELCVVNRGYRAEIDVFPGKPLENKLQGNVVDICPVGSLLDKDFLFCVDPSKCKAAIVGQLSHFAATTGMLGFGDTVLNNAYDAGILDHGLHAISPRDPKWARIGPWLTHTRALIPDEAAGQQDVFAHWDATLERQARGLARLARYQGAALARHSLAPEDGLPVTVTFAPMGDSASAVDARGVPVPPM